MNINNITIDNFRGFEHKFEFWKYICDVFRGLKKAKRGSRLLFSNRKI